MSVLGDFILHLLSRNGTATALRGHSNVSYSVNFFREGFPLLLGSDALFTCKILISMMHTLSLIVIFSGATVSIDVLRSHSMLDVEMVLG